MLGFRLVTIRSHPKCESGNGPKSLPINLGHKIRFLVDDQYSKGTMPLNQH